jgi:hypothetical protein
MRGEVAAAADAQGRRQTAGALRRCVTDDAPAGCRSSEQISKKGEVIWASSLVTAFVSIDGVFEDPAEAEKFALGGCTFEYDRGEEVKRLRARRAGAAARPVT